MYNLNFLINNLYYRINNLHILPFLIILISFKYSKFLKKIPLVLKAFFFVIVNILNY